MNNQYEEFDIKELIHTIQKKMVDYCNPYDNKYSVSQSIDDIYDNP